MRSHRCRCASRIKVLKAYFGELPIKSLEEPEVINRFKSDSEYADEVAIATLHKVLATLRAAIHWGQAQTPPLIVKSPFHRFGVRLNKKAETTRDRRISREEEQRLLDTARGDEHLGASVCRPGDARPDRWRAGALLPAWRDVADSEQARALGNPPDRHPGHTTKDRENRRIPFDAEGRLAAILQASRTLGPDAFVFGTRERRVPGEHPRRPGTPCGSWRTAISHGATRRATGGTASNCGTIDLHWHDLRHEGASRLLADGVDIRIIQLMLGHSSVQQTQRYLNVTDEELRKGLEVSWNRGRALRLVAGGPSDNGTPERDRVSHQCHTEVGFVVRPGGFEPTAFGSGGQRSIQLSYGRTKL